MKKSSFWIATALVAGLLYSCGANMDSSKSSNDAMSAPAAPSASGAAPEYAMQESERKSDGTGYANLRADSIQSLMSSSAATGSPNTDTSHKFIRTADVRFRVKEVRTATFAIEKIAAKFGGYVAQTHLESVIDQVKQTPVSEDSTLLTTFYTVSNNMTLRIPAGNLDSTLRALGSHVIYLDYRRINVVDATLMILRERLAARRIAHSTSRLEDVADGSDAKLRDRAAVEEALFNKQTAADESLLRTLEIKDQVDLSTVTLQIYQRQAWTREMVANEKNIDAYKPGFFHDLGEAITRGWEGLKAIAIAFMQIWPVWVIVLGALFAWRVYRRKKRQSN